MTEISINRRDLLQATSAGVLGTAGFSHTGAAEASSGGDKIWEFETGDVVRASPTVVNDTVFVGTWDEKLHAIDAEDGTEQWSFSTDASIIATIAGAPAVVDQTVYVGTNMRGYGRVYAIDSSDGSKEWRYKTGSRVVTSPTVVDGTVFVGNDGGSPGNPAPNLYALDADDGSEVWTFQTEGNIRSSPTVVDETVYFGSDDGSVYAVKTSDGSERWSTKLGRWPPVRSSPTVVDGTVYVGYNDRDGNDLYALDSEDGSIQWEVNIGQGTASSPTVVEDTLYVGNNDQRIYAVNTDDGSVRWAFNTNDTVTSSPTVGEDVVYTGSWDGTVYALYRTDGSEMWTFDGGKRIQSSPTVVEGTLYIGSGIARCCEPGDGEGAVYALNAGIEGSSNGSRVSLGTLGHHHTFADEELPEPDEPDIGPDGELTGTVSSVDERPLAGATVRVYDATEGADAVITRTTTGDDGTYAVDDLETDNGEVPKRVLLVVRDGDWFGSVEIDNVAEKLPFEHDFELDRELLFGPKIAADGRELSALTCWRHVHTRRRQTIFLEAVNLASSGTRSEITTDPADLTNGAFALTVLADDVSINFGSQSDVSGTVPSRVEAVGLGTSIDNTELSNWHPTRTGLPLYQVGNEVDAAFERMSTADADVADVIDEGLGTITGILPGVSTLLTWADTIEWAFGERLESEATLGAETVTFPDPTDPSAAQTRINPNEHTTARLAWRSDNVTANANEGAVVMAVPLEFQYDDERTSQVTAEAEWTHPNAHVSFGTSFEVGPVGTEEGSDG
jgi:outer membrane protein assembly factor BamB